MKQNKKYSIYKMVDNEDNVLYVGKSTCLDSRMKTHFGIGRANWINDVSDVYASFYDNAAAMDILEVYLINKYKPKYNSEFKREEVVQLSSMDSLVSEWVKLHPYAKKDIVLKKNPIHIIKIPKKLDDASVGMFIRLLENSLGNNNIFFSNKRGGVYMRSENVASMFNISKRQANRRLLKLIKTNCIKKTKVGDSIVFVCNPNVALYGHSCKRDTFMLFNSQHTTPNLKKESEEI